MTYFSFPCYTPIMLPAPIPQMLAHCPLCHAAYGDGAVQLVGDLPTPVGAHRKPRMFHMTCKNCDHAVIAVIQETVHGVSSIGLVTDLEIQDAVRVRDAAPVSHDDVIQAHVALEADRGGLYKILAGG